MTTLSMPLLTSGRDKRGFRPEIPYSEAISIKYQRRFSHVPGLYTLIFANGDLFVGMADDLGDTLTKQPTSCLLYTSDAADDCCRV